MKSARFIGSIVTAAIVFYLIPASGNTGEVGMITVSQASAAQWHAITTNYTYTNPVVIMGPPTDQDSAPLAVRVRNVTATGFEFQLDRWDYLPAAHGEETLSYLVIEAGSHTLANGARIQAGIRSGVTYTFPFYFTGFSTTFSSTPNVFAQTVTVNDPGAVTTQIAGISVNGFLVRLIVEEANKGTGHPAEDVAWVAIESSSLGGLRRYIAGISDRRIGSVPLPIDFGEGGFSGSSPFLSHPRNYNDDDPASMRHISVESSSAIVYQQEEQSQTSETGHELDYLSFAVFESAGDIPFVPHAPFATDDSITINPFGMVNLDVLANDTDEEDDIDLATLSLNSGPSFGTVSVDTVNGRMTYTNTASPGATDVFTYLVSDSMGAPSNIATVTINFDSADRLPNTTVDLPESIPLGSYKVENLLPDLSFSQPVNMAIPPGESQRLFVVQKHGIIYVIDDINSPTPTKQIFLDLSAKVSTTAERGMMGLAFHPDYANNGTFFLVYSDNVILEPNPFPGNPTVHSILSRFQVSAGDPNLADPLSETILIKQVDRDPGHQAGDLEFGPDGYLYYSIGDEGSQQESYNNSQTITKHFFSAIIRIDVDKLPGNLEPNPHPSLMTDGGGLAYYSIPADNPWVGATGFEGVPFAPSDVVRTEFYAVGLRNPWQMSFDPLTGELYVGDVGRYAREEINKIVAGGNYQWAYNEGSVDGPKSAQKPAGFTGIPPLYDYSRSGSPAAVIGGIVYRGSLLPGLTGAYIFADHQLNKIWALRQDGGEITVDLVAYEGGITSFLADPNNGDILISDFEGKIWRLVEDTAAAPDIPDNLTKTGVFADLSQLIPNPGVYKYDPILRFWSDYGIKSRWFSIADLADKMTWDMDEPWTYPPGMVFIKHFDLELVRGNPATKKRVETRVLVKTTDGVYGLSFQWNATDTEAYLVPVEGASIDYDIDDGGVMKTQTWQIPGRADCIQCHTSVAGDILSFNTRQLNQPGDIFGVLKNQLEALEDAGYFTNTVDPTSTLPRYVRPDDTSQSLADRVRSYLSVNCISCHQPGGSGPTTWDARPEMSWDETGLINGIASIYGSDPSHRIIIPGMTNESILLSRLTESNGFTRMPPLATSEQDEEAIQLITDWILSLSGFETLPDWLEGYFPGETNEAIIGPNADSDSDFIPILLEWSYGLDPLVADTSETSSKFFHP